jgi:hypothetical protein
VTDSLAKGTKQMGVSDYSGPPQRIAAHWSKLQCEANNQFQTVCTRGGKDSHLMQIFVRKQGEAELRAAAQDTGWTSLEECLEALLLV